MSNWWSQKVSRASDFLFGLQLLWSRVVGKEEKLCHNFLKLIEVLKSLVCPTKKQKQSLWLSSWVEGIKCQQVTILQTTDKFNPAHVIYWHFYDTCQSTLWAGFHNVGGGGDGVGEATDHCSGLCFNICKCETDRASTKHTAGSIFWSTTDTGENHYLVEIKKGGLEQDEVEDRSLVRFVLCFWVDVTAAELMFARVVRPPSAKLSENTFTVLLKQIIFKCAFSVKV